MNASQYQQLAARTLIGRPDFEISETDMMILWNALGLAGEAGEVAETVKKGDSASTWFGPRQDEEGTG